MSTTVVESLPVYFFKLKSDANNMSGCGTKTGTGAGCAAGQADTGFSGCASNRASAALPNYSASNRLLNESTSYRSKLVSYLKKVREPVADYLERHGLPKNAQCSFVSLMTSLIQRSYNAAVTILMMLLNLFPLLDGFVYLLRFILDKLIEILETKDRTETILKSLLFIGELIILFIVVTAIFGVILMPVWSMVGYVLHKGLGIVSSVK